MRILYSYLFLGLITSLSCCSTDELIDTAGTNSPNRADRPIQITTLSTKPWLITGGDVLVEVRLKPEIETDQISYALNGQDVTSSFRDFTPGSKQALLEGLPIGDSELLVYSNGRNYSESLMLTNYPISGPVLSGNHEVPFICEAGKFKTVSGETLGQPADEDCMVQTQVDYVYWSDLDQAYKPWRSTYAVIPPVDLGYISKPDGDFIPFIVRTETGVVNRAIYEIAMLHEEVDEQLSPWQVSQHWNRKLVFTHGGGCRGGWFRQGTRTGGVMRRELFEQGFAVVSSTFNVFGQNCNDLLASETHIMLKERFIERYGVPIYTVATGSSGGSYQSHQTADNYPGVFDGIIVGASFPDVISSTIFTLADARLLHYYFTQTSPDSFSIEQQRAISGFGVWESIPNLARGAARLDPLLNVGASAEEQGGELGTFELENRRYNLANTEGVRATVYDHAINVYGDVMGGSKAQRPLDNVGVQYGLAALNQGLISRQQFIELNRDIGGFDRDMNHVADRHRADIQAVRRALESGRILNGGGGLASTAIIDYRNYMDSDEQGNIHMLIHQFSTRQRLIDANGHADNHIMQIGGRWDFDTTDTNLEELFIAMDKWLLGVKGDTRDYTLAEKVVENRPTNLNDACWVQSDESLVKIEEPQTFRGSSRCNELYPAYSTPRHVAGGPLSNGVVSCKLRPITPADYGVGFTQDQYNELREIFPQGVCDWASGDVSRATLQATWVSFGPSPVNILYEPEH